MPKIVLKGQIVVPAAELVAVLAELPRHIALTREEEGCLRFNVEQDPEELDIFRVHEEFVDRLAFDSHQLRVKESVWSKVSANVKRHYEITEVS